MNAGKEKWDLLAIWLIEGVCLIWGPFSTGLTEGIQFQKAENGHPDDFVTPIMSQIDMQRTND